MKHGTRAAYSNLGCRCPECKAANKGWARKHLIAAYLPAAEKEQFANYIARKGLSPSHAVRESLVLLFRERP
jgi:hypothetical protein